MIQRRLNVPRIDQRLVEMNLTRDGFKAGLETDVDRRTIERLLSGKTRNAQAKTVTLIAEFLGLPPREILLIPEVDTASRPRVTLRLPITGAHLLGRTQELERLDKAWASPHIHLVSIVALGGTGKSALVNHWLGRLAQKHWRGVPRVFGWTFARQGIQATVASADEFLDAALRFCADPQPTLGTPTDKGARLAQLLCQTRTLMVLDGLEPFQDPPGPSAGQVHDPALATLLRAVALHNPGLCVLTTRLAVADLAPWQDTMAPVLALDRLSDDTGAALLQALGCTGADAERQATARECRGHALTLELLGTYLRDVYGGDVRRRHEVATVDGIAEEDGQAWQVMASYERWLGPGPEVAVLRLLGLFDRVASAEELAVLRAEPCIPALNEALIGQSEHQWLQTLRRVRAAGLVAPADPHRPHALDAHPLVRTYARQTLRTQYPAAWRAGHARLFTALQAAVVETYPVTLEGLAPLYAAVAHGCLAGRVEDALQVFRQRIRRGEQQFSLAHLGAYGVELATLAHGFTVLWSAVVPGLSADDQLLLFHAAGECLSALGRVHEAQAPLQHAVTLATQQHHWAIAALAATRLSEVLRAQGDLPTALRTAAQGAAAARHPGVPPQVYVLSHAFYGFALLWVGQFTEALTTFQEAERVQDAVSSTRPLLHGVLGYMYSELLLDQLASEVGELSASDKRACISRGPYLQSSLKDT